MRGLTILFVITVLVGGILSIHSIPDDHQLGWFAIKDKNFRYAQEIYETKWQETTKTLETALPLVHVYRETAEIDNAVALMESFVADQATNATAQAFLRDLYKEAGMMASYIEHIEARPIAERTDRVIREQLAAYARKGLSDKHEELLRYIVSTGRANAEESTNLALLEASRGNYERATDLLLRVDDDHPQVLEMAQRKTLFSLLLEQGKNERAISLGQQWFANGVAPEEGLALLYWLINIGYPDLVGQIIHTVENETASTASFRKLILDTAIARDDDSSVYALLEKWQQGEGLPADLVPIYVELALRKGAVDIVRAMLERLRVVYSQDAYSEGIYLEALAACGETEELTRFWQTKISSGPLTSDQEENALIALLQLEQFSVVLPRLKTKAKNKGGEWLSSYIHAATVLGREDEIVEVMRAQGFNETNTSDERRQAAYYLLEKGDKESAERIFFGLAADAPHDSPDVEALFFLWGPRPDNEALVWMQSRARDADKQEKVAWIEGLMRVGAYQQVIDIFEDMTDAQSMAIADIYVDVHKRRGNEKEVRQILPKAVENSKNVSSLRRFAWLAEKLDDDRLAENTWRRVLELEPTDTEALKQLAVRSYDAHRWVEARDYFQLLLSEDEADYEASYLYAETLYELKQLDEAQKYYQRALQQLSRHERPSTREQVLKARMLGKTGRPEDAIQVFNRVFDAEKSNSALRSDYAAFLLEYGYIEEAQALVETP